MVRNAFWIEIQHKLPAHACFFGQILGGPFLKFWIDVYVLPLFASCAHSQVGEGNMSK